VRIKLKESAAMLRIEQEFSRPGVQPPVLVPEAVESISFALLGKGSVEFSMASVADMRRGRAGWARFEAGNAGALYGVSGIRARGEVGGKLVVVFSETDTPDEAMEVVLA
jgi:hypothetical protein